MSARRFTPHRRRREKVRATPAAEALVRAAERARTTRAHGYRERSLALHGWICARCAREFEAPNLPLLTVHHRDGDHEHNPPDGSNWENLCVYCHEAEHTQEALADYLSPPPRSRHSR